VPTTTTTPPVSLDAQLDEFRRTARPKRRIELARRLASLAPFRDDRILAALVCVLDEDPFHGVPLLRSYGDPRGGVHLSRAFDRIARGHHFCTGHRAKMLERTAEAMEALGKGLSPEQLAMLGRAHEDAAGDPCYEEEDHEPRPAEPARAAPGPSRNAPCPCGSGRKFKKCCG